MMKCDFCLTPVSEGQYHTVHGPEFAILAPGMGIGLDSLWCCCNQCYALFVAHDLPELISRSCTASGIMPNDESMPFLSELFTEIYNRLSCIQ